MFCTRLTWIALGLCSMRSAPAIGLPLRDDESQYISIDDDISGANVPDREDRNFPPDILLNITFSGYNTVNLTLRRNRKINADVPIYFMDLPDEPQKVPAVKDVGFYQDSSNGAVFTAKLSKEDGKVYRRYEGIFTHTSGRYELLPFNPIKEDTSSAFKANNGVKSAKSHIFYRVRKLKENLNTDGRNTIHAKPNGYKQYISADKEEREYSFKRRHKRAIGDYKYIHVELAFVLDCTEWDYWLAKSSNNVTEATLMLKLYFAYQMNGMDMVFTSIDVASLGFTISVWLKEIRISRMAETSYWTVQNRVGSGRPRKVNARAALDLFSSWRGHNSSDNWTWSDPDHAMLWTRFDLVSDTGESSITGLAWLGGVCFNEWGSSIIENIGYDAFLVAAHELGHNLGSKHDGELKTEGDYPEYENTCLAADQYLMSPFKANLGALNDTIASNPFTFSSCSLDAMANLVNGVTDGYPRTCISNIACNHPEWGTERIPDVTYSIDYQCVTHYGQGSILCQQLYSNNSIDYEELCFNLWCYVPGVGCRQSDSIVPAEGTDCTPSGDGSKVCSRARCIEKLLTLNDIESCTPTSIGLEVPDSCFELDPEFALSDGSNTTCSAYVNNYPRSCYSDHAVQKYCCFFCKAYNNTIVCPDDYGFTVLEQELTCEDITEQHPSLCLTFPRVTEFCCAACHRAGLVYIQQTASESSTETNTSPAITTSTTDAASTTTTTDYTSTATTSDAPSPTTTTTTTHAPSPTTSTGDPSTTTTTYAPSPTTTTNSPSPITSTGDPSTITTTVAPTPTTTIETPPSTTITNFQTTNTTINTSSSTTTAVFQHTIVTTTVSLPITSQNTFADPTSTPTRIPEISTTIPEPVEVTGVYPTHGPVSGGTRVMISVTGLRQDDLAAVRIGPQQSDQHSWISGAIIIITSFGHDTNEPQNISLLLTDDSVIGSSFTFTYKPDPVVTNIYPLNTIRSGGTKLTVEGRYLDSVAEPVLQLTIIPVGTPGARRRREAPEDVTLTSECLKETVTFSRMTCQTPNTTEYISQNPNEEYDLYMGLVLDGVPTYRNLTAVLPQYGELNLHSDPTFTTWSGVKEIEPGKHISVEGNTLAKGSGIDDYTVKIGEGRCMMKELLDNEFLCLPPTKPPPQTAEDQLLGPNGYNLLVRVGSSALNHVGPVRYKPSKEWDIYVIAGYSVTGTSVVIAFIIACVWIRVGCKTRREITKLEGDDTSPERTNRYHDNFNPNDRAVESPGWSYAPRIVGQQQGEWDYLPPTDQRGYHRGFIFPYINPWKTRGPRVDNVYEYN